MTTATREPRRAGKLGKHPRRDDPRTLSFRDYRDKAVPQPPASRSWDHGITSFGAMLNDRYGDCTCAAIGHAIQIATANASQELTLPDSAILSAYEDVCPGFNPQTDANDNGAVELDVLRYWQNHGVAGHKCAAYAACSTTNLDDVKACVNLFGFSYIGFQVPAHAIPDFEAGRTWDVQSSNNDIIGGHAVVIVDYDTAAQVFTVITWGGLQKMTFDFFHAYCDEAYGVVTPEWIAANGQTPSGLNLQQLLTDVQQLRQAPDPAPQPSPTPTPTPAKTLKDYDGDLRTVIAVDSPYDLNEVPDREYLNEFLDWIEGATVLKPIYQAPPAMRLRRA